MEDVNVLQRRADQAWEMAALARQDGDNKDAQRYTAEARKYERKIRERTGTE